MEHTSRAVHMDVLLTLINDFQDSLNTTSKNILYTRYIDRISKRNLELEEYYASKNARYKSLKIVSFDMYCKSILRADIVLELMNSMYAPLFNELSPQEINVVLDMNNVDITSMIKLAMNKIKAPSSLVSKTQLNDIRQDTSNLDLEVREGEILK
jgi:hypothetical protein